MQILKNLQSCQQEIKIHRIPFFHNFIAGSENWAKWRSDHYIRFTSGAVYRELVSGGMPQGRPENVDLAGLLKTFPTGVYTLRRKEPVRCSMFLPNGAGQVHRSAQWIQLRLIHFRQQDTLNL